MLTPDDFAALQQANSSDTANSSLFALVDHAGIPGLAKELTAMRVHWISLFAGSRDEGALQVAPLLFPVDADQNSPRRKALLRRLGQGGTFTSCIAFLLSPLPLPELARRLALRLDARLPDDMEIVLRFFDTRVFEQLMLVLSGEQQRAFLGVAQCWWYVDRRGALQYVEAEFIESDESYQSLSLSTLQEAALLDASEPDQVAELLRNVVPREYEALEHEEQYDFIVRNADAGRIYGIESVQDLALYCSLALLYKEDFTTQTKWAKALGEVKAGSCSLAEAITRTEESE